MYVFFCGYIFGCPKASFGPLTIRQPHSPYVNHNAISRVQSKGHWNPLNKVVSKSSVKGTLSGLRQK